MLDFFFNLTSSLHIVEPLLLVGVEGFSPFKFGAYKCVGCLKFMYEVLTRLSAKPRSALPNYHV